MEDDEPVARILDMKLLKGVHFPQHYFAGKFMPVVTSGNMTGPVQDVPAVILRHENQLTGAVASIGTLLYIGDFIKTGPDTIMAIEFLIGGRGGVNRGTCIEIVNERSVADGHNGARRLVLKNAALWTKADAKALKQPLEIQTNGGTMAIKG